MMAKAGIPEDQAAQIITDISAGDEEPWDRLTAVRTTYGRAASGGTVGGYMTLRNELPVEVMDHLDTTMDRIRATNRPPGPTLIFGGKKHEPELSEVDSITEIELPDSAYYGWFRDYRDMMLPTTEASAVFHLGASLAMVGAVIGRGAYVRHAGETMYPNMYNILVGETGRSRKDTAMKRATGMWTHGVNPGGDGPYHEIESVGSPEALVKEFVENPTILWRQTEMSMIFVTMNQKGTRNLRERLIQLWDTPDMVRNLVVNKDSRGEAKMPFLSLVGGIQPGRLADAMTVEEIHSGLANRMMFFPGSPQESKPDPPQADTREMGRLFNTMKSAVSILGKSGRGTRFDLDPAARSLFSDWYVRIGSQKRSDERMQEITVRHQNYMLKIALMHAVTDGDTVIRVSHLEPAMEIMAWQERVLAEAVPTWGSEVEQKIEQTILRMGRKHGSMSKSDYARKCTNRAWGAVQYNRVMEAMLKQGTVETVSENGIILYALAG